jgi:hypothetical protein
VRDLLLDRGVSRMDVGIGQRWMWMMKLGWWVREGVDRWYCASLAGGVGSLGPTSCHQEQPLKWAGQLYMSEW